MLILSWFSVFYLMSIADKFNSIILVFAIIFGFISVVCQGIHWDRINNSSTTSPSTMRLRWLSFTFSIVCFILYAMIPSKRDMVLIVVGGTVFEYVQKDSSLQQLPYEISAFMKEQISSWKNELKTDQIEDKFKNMSKDQLIEYMKQNDVE